ncbi:MAG: twin-arginine translocation pathway signal protein [Rhizorhabdus sp.]
MLLDFWRRTDQIARSAMKGELMNLNSAGAKLTVMSLILAGCPIIARASAATSAVPQTTASAPTGQQSPGSASSFVPTDFLVPTLVETANFKIVPLGPDLVKVDFDAYMSSVDHLQKTFTRSTDWPHKGISDSDAMRDMETEQARFRNRTSFAYAVLTPDGRRERGCVYVYPSTVEGYDAVVKMWVTKAEYDAGFDAELYAWVVRWMQKDWPVAKVAYPGRAIEWAAWDSIVATSNARNAKSE